MANDGPWEAHKGYFALLGVFLYDWGREQLQGP